MQQMQWTLPRPLDQTAQYMQQTLTPCSLFALGASMVRFRLDGNLNRIAFVIATKMCVLPIGVAVLAVKVFALDPVSCAVLTIIAAQPSPVAYYIMAERYDVERATAAGSVLVTSLVSIVAIPTVLYLLHRY